MIITVGNTKGGVGKTTLAVQLAAARVLSGRNVLLIDGDRQGTALMAMTARTELAHRNGIICCQYYEARTLRSQFAQQAKRFDDVVIDVGGRDDTVLRQAMLLTDRLVVPFLPRSYELWALGDLGPVVDEAQETREGLGRARFLALAVLNRADPAGTDNDEAREAVRSWRQFQLAPCQLGQRKAWAAAGMHGLAVSETNPRDAKACDELEALVAAVFNPQDISE